LQDINAYNARMNLEQLQTLIEVMRRGSFAAVARDNDLDPSSVSRDIANLEQALGVRLFERTTKRLTPTEAGMLYAARLEPLLLELEQARLEVQDIKDTPRGMLRVASPVSFGLAQLVPLLPEFSRRYPELQIDLTLSDQKTDLLEHHLDVALRLSAEREKDIIAEPLQRMVSRVCASPSYLHTHGTPSSPADLVAHHCLALKYEGFGQTWRFTDTDGFSSEVQIAPRLQTSNALALVRCALAGMGITLQARWMVQGQLESGELVDLFPNHSVTAALHESPFIWMLYPSRAYQPRKVEVLIAFLRQNLKN
jgi:DNA-binding transcriptional LysR family regulator